MTPNKHDGCRHISEEGSEDRCADPNREKQDEVTQNHERLKEKEENREQWSNCDP